MSHPEARSHFETGANLYLRRRAPTASSEASCRCPAGTRMQESIRSLRNKDILVESVQEKTFVTKDMSRSEHFSSWQRLDHGRVKIKKLSPRQIVSVACHICGVRIGEACTLQIGDRRFEPHADRRMLANKAIEQRLTERHLANLKEWTDELYRSKKPL